MQLSESGQELGPETVPELTKHFKLKVINHNRKSEYRVFSVRNNENVDLQTFEAMKAFILSKIPADLPKPDPDTLEFGFIHPRHGLDGRKEWLYSDEDVKDMIKAHKEGSVTLWCYNCKKPVTNSRSSGASNSKEGNRSRSRSPHCTMCNKSKDESSSSKSTTSASGGSQYESQMKKMETVDKIYKHLEEKYRDKYSPEQLRAWAHDRPKEAQ